MTTWTVAPDTPTTTLVDAVERAMGKRATAWRKPHTGITAAQRFIVTFADGASAFVKAPVDAQTTDWSQREHHVLSHLDAPFAPRVLFSTDTLLITEDLSGAYWPADNPGAGGAVTWLPGQADALLATLDQLAGAAPELDVPPLAEGKRLLWPAIAAAPDDFALRPGTPRDWIEAFAAAETLDAFAGDAVVHNDVRSDNVCFVGERCILVDWTNACRGTSLWDRVEFALTYAIEGGPPPWELVPDAEMLPVWQAALLLTRAHDLAGHAPAWLVAVLERVAGIAVEWAARNLNLRA